MRPWNLPSYILITPVSIAYINSEYKYYYLVDMHFHIITHCVAFLVQIISV